MTISVTLSPEVDHLWHSVHALQNEMIISASGRKIFPSLKYSVAGLDPQKMYMMSFHLELQDDDKMLKYINKQYIQVPSNETKRVPKKVSHHHGAQSGSYWMKNGIHFDSIKVTNKKAVEEQNPFTIHLFAQHRYVPVLEIYENGQRIQEVRIAHTLFVALTGYNNPAVTKFKTNTNPYAKRFRSNYSPQKLNKLAVNKSPKIKKQDVLETTPTTPDMIQSMIPASPPTLPPFSPFPMFNPFLAMGLSYYNMFNSNYQFPVLNTESIGSYPYFPTPSPSITPSSRQSPVQKFVKEELEDYIEVTVD